MAQVVFYHAITTKIEAWMELVMMQWGTEIMVQQQVSHDPVGS